MHTRNTTLNNTLDIKKTLQLVLVFFFTIGMISLHHQQIYTGPIVNAMLLITLTFFGQNKAILLGILTPIAAAFAGILPVTLLLMLPFITLGNMIYISVFNLLKNKNSLISIGAASLAKFMIISASITFLYYKPASIFISGKIYTAGIPAIMLQMMTWPQLITAIIGGYIAVGFIKLAHKAK